jgi:hypothetical protein
MKKLLILIVSLVLFVVQPDALYAQKYQQGWVSSDGYTWRDGYWWMDGYAYTRTAGRYYNYKSCKWCSRYTYHLSHKSQKLSVKDPDWRNKLLDMLNEEAERQAFDRALQDTGLASSSYGKDTGVLSLKNLSELELRVQQGDTKYYSSNSIKEYVRSDRRLDYIKAVDRQQQIAEKLADLSGGSLAELTAMLRESITADKDIEKMKVAGEVLQALQSPKDESVTLKFRQDGHIERVREPENVDTGLWRAVFSRSCVSCHSGNEPRGGFSMATNGEVRNFTDEEWDKIENRIIHGDPNKRMPLAKDLGPGVPLTKQIVKLILKR